MSNTLAQEEIEVRTGGGYQVAEVNFPKRTVTCVAMPYERPTMIPYGSKTVTEVVSRTAFTGIEKRTSQVRVNRDHSWDKPVGKVIALHPSRKEGLVAEVKISATPLGEETLALCNDDVLSASVGFGLLRRDDGRVWEDAEVWEQNHQVRRLNRLWLDHLALVPNPAYTDAAVLNVRKVGALTPDLGDTPNRDLLVVLAQRAELDELNRRWA